MLNEWQAAKDRNDREKTDNAREAAEALFKPRPPAESAAAPTSAADVAPAAEPERRRQPRVFVIPPQSQASPAETKPRPIRREPALPPQSRKIAPAQFGQVRALATYGMTRAQVAEHYGVTEGEIDAICDRPPRSQDRSAR